MRGYVCVIRLSVPTCVAQLSICRIIVWPVKALRLCLCEKYIRIRTALIISVHSRVRTYCVVLRDDLVSIRLFISLRVCTYAFFDYVYVHLFARMCGSAFRLTLRSYVCLCQQSDLRTSLRTCSYVSLLCPSVYSCVCLNSVSLFVRLLVGVRMSPFCPSLRVCPSLCPSLCTCAYVAQSIMYLTTYVCMRVLV